MVLIAVNNVGANIRKATVEYTAEDYSYIQRTNLESAYNLTQVGLLRTCFRTSLSSQVRSGQTASARGRLLASGVISA